MTQNNYVDASGLHLEDRETIVANMIDSMKTIYGQDINVDPNSPDRLMIETFAQAKADLLDTIAQVYNSFDPDTAVGSVLRQRVAINGIAAFGASYTRVPITIVTDQTVTLQGLDTTPNAPFTIKDTSGNRFFLEETVTLSSGTTAGLIFQAAVAGVVSTTLNTVNIVETITLGVVSVNNPSANIQTGEAEETDPQLRLRRARAVSSPSVGFLESLTGALALISGVTDSVVYENITSSTDVYGVPGHSIWAIVDGGTDADIGDVIYRKRNAGCGMKGSEVVDVPQVNGTTFQVLFDRPLYSDLYVRIVLDSLNASHTPDAAYIRTQIVNQISYGIYDPADFTAMTALIKELDPLAVVVSGGFTNLASGTAVTFQDTGDTVTLSSHGLAANTAITFLTIVSTTGISTSTTYYVKAPTTNTFQVSSTPGGAALTLTTNGSGTMKVNDSSLEPFKYPATIQSRWLLADSPSRIDITVL